MHFLIFFLLFEKYILQPSINWGWSTSIIWRISTFGNNIVISFFKKFLFCSFSSSCPFDYRCKVGLNFPWSAYFLWIWTHLRNSMTTFSCLNYCCFELAMEIKTSVLHKVSFSWFHDLWLDSVHYTNGVPCERYVIMRCHM